MIQKQFVVNHPPEADFKSSFTCGAAPCYGKSHDLRVEEKRYASTMRNLIIILLTSLSNVCYSQSNNLPQLQDYSLLSTRWQDTIISHQKLFWPNGKVKLDYVQLHDSIKLRKEYFESGNLKLTAEIYQSYYIESFYINDTAKPGTLIRKESAGYIDMLHGNYYEYWDATGVTAKTSGFFKHGKQVEEWKERQDDASLIIANYNSNGQLEGPYFEYFFNGFNERADIKWKGQFSVVSHSFTEQDEMTLKPIGQSEITESVRSGIWEHYNRSGELLETLIYQWIKK